MAASVSVNDDSETARLLANSMEASTEPKAAAPQNVATDQEPQNLVVDSVLKLQCFVYVLGLIAVGFIAALIETESFAKSNNFTTPRDLNTIIPLKPTNAMGATLHINPNNWICWAVKCAYPITAIVAIIYLRKFVFVPGMIERGCIYDTAQPDRRVIINGIYRFIKVPQGFGSYPSALYVATYIIFTIPYCLAVGIDIICGIIDATNPATKEKEITDIVRRVLLLTYAVMQTNFFFVHYRQSIQWKLSASWFCGCHILATNIAAWFFNVGWELRELITDNHTQFSRGSYCAEHSINTFSTFLYSFVIEYYVMSALMAFTLVANTGRLGSLLQSHMDELLDAPETTDRIGTLLRRKLHAKAERVASEFATLRKYPLRFALGLMFVVVSLVVSIFVGFNHTNSNKSEIRCAFYCVLVFLYFCGIVCIVKLLCSLNKNSKRQITSAHLTDRLLLWLGAAAVAVNDFYTFWIAWTKMRARHAPIERANHILLATSCALNIGQSLAQVYALECALIRKFPACPVGGGRADHKGRALLNLLILLNTAEWIVNTVCFSFFFPPDQMDNALVLSLMMMPLQVFYRFHSAACIHDFKRHCEEVDTAAEEEATPPAEAAAASAAEAAVAPQGREMNFPNMPSLVDSVLSFQQSRSALWRDMHTVVE